MLALAVAVLGVGATSASAVELHGYWRAGVGGSSAGGGQTCFKLGQTGHKYRLGNECEAYGEIEFRQNLYKDRTGVEFNFVTMLAVQSDQQQDFESLKDDGNDIAFRQAWIGAKLPQLGGSTIWAGKRYYHRNDVHIVDYYYWDPSGFGAGIEDITLGPVKFAAAAFQTTSGGAPATAQIWRPDFRVYDVPFFGFGTLEVGLDLFLNATNNNLSQMGPDAQTVSPWVTVQHFVKNDGFLGGYNKIAVQYATGSAAPMTGYAGFNNTSDSKQFRVVEQMVFNPVPQISGMLFAEYADFEKKYAGGDELNDFNTARVYSIGARPQWHFNDYFRVAVEAGLDIVDPQEDDSGVSGNRQLTKLTVAPTWSAGPGFWARPELRLFATWAHWNDEANERGVQSGGFGTCDPANPQRAFGCDNDGFTFGAQMEAWW
jgi:maltoporin